MFTIKTRFRQRGWIGALVIIGLCAPLPLGAQTQGDSDFDKIVSQGEAAFARGWLDEAILYWTGALDAAVKLGQPADRVDVLARRAEAYQVLGYVDKSMADLETAIELAEAQGASDTVARLRGSLGNVYTLAGKAKAAQAEFDVVLAHAAAAGDKLLEARTLNNLGNLMFEQKLYDEAAGLYQRSGALAAGRSDLRWTVAVNAAYAMSAGGHAKPAEQLLEEALDGADALPQTSATVNGLISIGRLPPGCRHRSVRRW